jgi:hypothetical protein
LTPEELAGLEKSVLAEGCRDDLVVWREPGFALPILLDGHNRLEICVVHDLPYQTTEIDLTDRNAAKRWIINNQFARRNLTTWQRCVMAQGLEKLLPSNQGKRTDLETTSVTNVTEVAPHRQAAQLAGVSHNTYAKSKVVAAHADEHTLERLRSGELSISSAYVAIYTF